MFLDENIFCFLSAKRRWLRGRVDFSRILKENMK